MSSAAHTSTPAPPVAPRRPVTRTFHGESVEDPYEWLRDADDPAVIAHLEAENAYAEARTAHLEPLRSAIFEEIKGRVQETDLTVPVVSGPWWYYTRTVEGGQYGVQCRAPRDLGSSRVPELDPEQPLPGEQVLLDGNAAAEGHEFFTLGAFGVSPDHSRLVYAVDVTGDERFDVTVQDLTTGEVLDESIRGIGYGVAFSRDGRYLFYVRVDDSWRPHEVWRHEIGTDPASDVRIYTEADERFWMGIGTSRDDRWLVLGIGSKTTSEFWVLDADDPTGELRCVAPRRDGIEYDVEVAGDHLLVVHNTRHPDGDLAWAPLDPARLRAGEPMSHEDWQPLLDAQPGQRFLGVDAFDDFAVLSLREGGLPALRILPRGRRSTPFASADYDPSHPVGFDDELHNVTLADTPEPGTDRIRVTHESWVAPRSVYDVEVATGERHLLKQQPVLGGVDLDAYVQRREWVVAADGAKVPLSIVHRAGVEPDGSNPALLYGYGSYEHSLDPYFSVARLSLLDRGVVFAVAHVRGGGEMGRGWYDDGKMAAKRNTFTDFVACAEHLVDAGWSAPDRLAAEGGSAGGLLMGAATNLAPDRFRVVLAAVPFVDALTTILKPELPLTVGEWEEWGNPVEDPEVYALMRSYTPYENITARDYPAILATTSLHDTRVSYTEPAKWVARLRETVTSDPQARPVLLRTEMTAGHGGRSGRYDAWRQVAWEWAFLLDQIGATETAFVEQETSR